MENSLISYLLLLCALIGSVGENILFYKTGKKTNLIFGIFFSLFFIYFIIKMFFS